MLVVECYADNIFIEQLLGKDIIANFGKSSVHSGKGEVGNRMYKNPNRKCVGLIDTDKGLHKKAGYLSEFTQHIDSFQGITITKHIRNNHYLISIPKEIEFLLLEEAVAAGIDVSRNKLPDNGKALGDITKDAKLTQNQNFRNFINNLVQKNPSKVDFIKKKIQQAINA